MQKTKKSRAYILPISLLLTSAFMFFAAAAFVPATGASTACTVTWVSPTGTYSPGSPITFSVNDPCVASGGWNLVSEPSGTLIASGTFSCPCASKVLFSGTAGTSPLTPGKFQIAGFVNGQNYQFSFEVDDFIVTNVLPLGTIAAAGVSLVGLLAVRRLSRTFSISTPIA